MGQPVNSGYKSCFIREIGNDNRRYEALHGVEQCPGKSKAFYIDVLGLKEDYRPPLTFPEIANR